MAVLAPAEHDSAATPAETAYVEVEVPFRCLRCRAAAPVVGQPLQLELGVQQACRHHAPGLNV